MTEQKAFSALNTMLQLAEYNAADAERILHGRSAFRFDAEVYKIAIDAVQKQIPYKPRPYKHYEGQCKCGVVFLDRQTNYCGNCGQRLDWEE